MVDDSCNYNEESRDKTYEIDNLALSLLNISTGDTVYWDDIEKRVPKIIEVWRAKICKECEWRSICEGYGKN